MGNGDGHDDYGMGDYWTDDINNLVNNAMGGHGMGGHGMGGHGMGSQGMGGMGGRQRGDRNEDGNIIINNNVNGEGCDNDHDEEDMVERVADAVVMKITAIMMEHGMDMLYSGHHDMDEAKVEPEPVATESKKSKNKNKNKNKDTEMP